MITVSGLIAAQDFAAHKPPETERMASIYLGWYPLDLHLNS